MAVDSGQHYDFELNALLYHQLGVEPPDSFLEVGSGTHAVQTAAMLVRFEELLRSSDARAAVVIGDTNSTLAACLAAAKLRIPVVHVEAGLRAADALMAEEINRRVVDSVASLLCAPGQRSAEQLQRESPAGRIVMTGDVAHDVLREQLGRTPPASSILPAGVEPPFAYVTLHRAELTETPGRLSAIIDELGRLPLPAIFPMHPRTRAALERAGLSAASRGTLTITPPVGYHESLALARAARVVITDSGGLQREAYWLGVPCLTLRAETEWLETTTLGANTLVPPDRAVSDLRPACDRLLKSRPAEWDRTVYGAGHAGRLIAEAVSTLVSGDA
jgi:UDP-N-acetylglucosamine 2-epimerase